MKHGFTNSDNNGYNRWHLFRKKLISIFRPRGSTPSQEEQTALKMIPILENEIRNLRQLLEDKDTQVQDMSKNIQTMEKEYERLQAQLSGNLTDALDDQKIAVYKSISQLLINYPMAVKKVRTNPEIKAKDMMGMLKPLENFLEFLGVDAIGCPGQIVKYNERLHVPSRLEFHYEDGQEVVIKSIGYMLGEKVLDKARVQMEEK